MFSVLTEAEWNPYSALLMMKNQSAVVVAEQFRARITTQPTTPTPTTAPRHTRHTAGGLALGRTLLGLLRKYVG